MEADSKSPKRLQGPNLRQRVREARLHYDRCEFLLYHPNLVAPRPPDVFTEREAYVEALENLRAAEAAMVKDDKATGRDVVRAKRARADKNKRRLLVKRFMKETTPSRGTKRLWEKNQ